MSIAAATVCEHRTGNASGAVMKHVYWGDRSAAPEPRAVTSTAQASPCGAAPPGESTEGEVCSTPVAVAGVPCSTRW